MVKASLRTKSVGTKVSDAEYAALEARARAENLTLSEWVRDALLGSSRAEKAEAAGDLVGEVLLAEVLALRTLFLNLRPLPDHAVPGEGEVRAEIARADATKMQRARERLAAQKKASEAGR
ncbi:MAG: hypothetical protein ABSF57_08225 [Acidobacteriaceae bacterium]|jgi:hypothetical protein